MKGIQSFFINMHFHLCVIHSQKIVLRVSEWFLFLHQMSKCSAISWQEQVTFWWHANAENRFAQHAELDCHSASSLKQQSTGNQSQVDMSLHWDTLFCFQGNQSLLLLLNAVCLEKKQQIPIWYPLVWAERSSKSRTIYCTWGEHASHYAWMRAGWSWRKTLL